MRGATKSTEWKDKRGRGRKKKVRVSERGWGRSAGSRESGEMKGAQCSG